MSVDTEIEQFKQRGSKIRISHYRNYMQGESGPWIKLSHAQLRKLKEKKDSGESFEYKSENISGRGGRTVIELSLPDGTQLKGESICCWKDNFNRRLGKSIAWGRLIRQYYKYLAASPDAVKFGNSLGDLVNGMWYYTVVNEVLYEVFPKKVDIEESVEVSRDTVKDLEWWLEQGNVTLLKESK